METVTLASNAHDSDALAAVERRNAELVGGLTARTATLLAAVRGGGDWGGERDALVAFARAEPAAQTEAAQAVLYPAAHALPRLVLLTRAMSHEHALLESLITRLQSAEDAPAALIHAGAVGSLFASHAAKETELLLPAMVAAPDISVTDLLADMQDRMIAHRHDAVHGAVVAGTPSTAEQAAEEPHGHACGCHEEAGTTPELDARTIPHAIRHATVFGALDAVGPEGELVLVAPHDPLPLLAQIEQRAPSAFAIEYLQRGPEAWRLKFTRVAVASASR